MSARAYARAASSIDISLPEENSMFFRNQFELLSMYLLDESILLDVPFVPARSSQNACLLPCALATVGPRSSTELGTLEFQGGRWDETIELLRRATRCRSAELAQYLECWGLPTGRCTLLECIWANHWRIREQIQEHLEQNSGAESYESVNFCLPIFRRSTILSFRMRSPASESVNFCDGEARF